VHTLDPVITSKIPVDISSNLSLSGHGDSIIQSSRQVRSWFIARSAHHPITRYVRYTVQLSSLSLAYLLCSKRVADGRRLEAVIRRGNRSGLFSSNQFSLSEVVDLADDNLYVHIHCNFICGLSDVIIKTFSQSVSLLYNPASTKFLRVEFCLAP